MKSIGYLEGGHTIDKSNALLISIAGTYLISKPELDTDLMISLISAALKVILVALPVITASGLTALIIATFSLKGSTPDTDVG
jgi:hypothetical protein